MPKKLLILHGWNWKNYPKHNKGNPWSNRLNFLNFLKENFEVTSPTLPGFCDSVVPDNSWDLDNYAEWLFQYVQKDDYDTLVGYSFGSPIIVRFLTLYANKLKKVPKIILISPAISRRYTHQSKGISKISNIFNKISPTVTNYLRNIYLTYIIKNPFYTEGDTFQKETYSNIVSIDLSQELETLIHKNFAIRLIFGSNDTSTPPELLLSAVPVARSITSIIQGGGHDIANSHTEELIHIIENIH